MREIKIEESWKELLKDVFIQPEMKRIREFLEKEFKEGKKIYPPLNLIFNAFNLTPVDKVKVIILGQDPYHGEGQAHGLSFSVLPPVPPPPSLVNIYKERSTDLNIPPSSTGDLTLWANQGILLLNSILTVEKGKASSHANQGWEWFTDRVLEKITSIKENLVLILWGSYAQAKISSLNKLEKHYIIKSPHPSPFSANRGFFGSCPFSKANNYLKSKGITPISWENS